ncbi:MAG: deoxyribodipyrimidine photolyase [Archangium sp.]
MRSPVPKGRVRVLNDAPPQNRDYILYWMTSFRRAKSNFALDRAIELAKQMKRPLLVFEALRCGYEFANDRLHTFVLEGMHDNERAFKDSAVTYLPYVERRLGEGKGLMEALVKRACIVVGDDWPCFFVPKMQQALAERIDCRFEVVDSNGLYPMHDTPRTFTTAHSFRVHLQKVLPAHLMQFPTEHPLSRLELPKLDSPLPKGWTFGLDVAVADLPIDHSVPAVPIPGGSDAAEERLAHFIAKILPKYGETRNEPELDGTSALSPYLHFGHISTHQVFAKVVGTEKWSVENLGPSIGGAKEGWWKLSANAEGYLDQIVTWRELSFNMTSHRPDDYRSLDELPDYARATIAKHAEDVRKYTYTLEELEQSRTHDRLWNATMGEMRQTGWFHNYLRMLWGKKIYEWSKSAADALHAMEYLMGKYSIDGRDPISYSGYFWILGRYDRAWGPERPVFGSLRYMASENTAKKLNVKQYMDRFAPENGSLF